MNDVFRFYGNSMFDVRVVFTVRSVKQKMCEHRAVYLPSLYAPMGGGGGMKHQQRHLGSQVAACLMFK